MKSVQSFEKFESFIRFGLSITLVITLVVLIKFSLTNFLP